MEVVTERLLHEERKLKERVGPERSREGAMTGKQRPKGKKGTQVPSLWKIWPHQAEL